MEDAVPCTELPAALRWPAEDSILAVALEDCEMGATFCPHLGAKDYPEYRNTYLPDLSPNGTIAANPDHNAGKLTGVPYIDLCCCLRGRGKNRAWIGTFAEAKLNGYVRPVLVEFKKFGRGIGFVPMRWQSPDPPKRIAILGLTPCGRVETEKINDGRNAAIFDHLISYRRVTGSWVKCGQ